MSNYGTGKALARRGLTAGGDCGKITQEGYLVAALVKIEAGRARDWDWELRDVPRILELAEEAGDEDLRRRREAERWEARRKEQEARKAKEAEEKRQRASSKLAAALARAGVTQEQARQVLSEVGADPSAAVPAGELA